jgi:NitT/TauT family transport system ATP-binding protein
MSGRVKVSLQGVGKTFSVRGKAPFTALSGVDLEIHEGELLALVGPSGCGKSTLLDLLSGLSRPTSGRILIDGEEVTGPSLNRGVVFQQYALLPWRTALGNVELGLEAKGVPRRSRAAQALEHLELVGLAGFADRLPHELSGGMKQRVAIARSLAFDPDVLLMDEPFAALDAQTRETLQEELLRIWRATGKTILFITHGIDEAVYLGQRVAVMSREAGRIKTVLEVPAQLGHGVDDVRSTPEFGRVRHEVWSLLRTDSPASPADHREVVGVG